MRDPAMAVPSKALLAPRRVCTAGLLMGLSKARACPAGILLDSSRAVTIPAIFFIGMLFSFGYGPPAQTGIGRTSTGPGPGRPLSAPLSGCRPLRGLRS